MHEEVDYSVKEQKLGRRCEDSLLRERGRLSWIDSLHMKGRIGSRLGSWTRGVTRALTLIGSKQRSLPSALAGRKA
jgi:hypothetical protein